MNYAIRVLLDTGKRLNNELEITRAKFLESDFEMSAGYTFALNDIQNMEKQIEEIITAIEKLAK